MPDNASPFLIGARHEAGYVHQHQERNVEGVAKPHETRPLDRGVHIQHARQRRRIVRNHANRPPPDPGKPDQQVRRKIGLQFKEIAVVYKQPNRFQHFVGLVRMRRHQVVKRIVHAVRRIVGLDKRRSLLAILRNKA